MSETRSGAVATKGTDVRIGLTVEGQRSADLRQVIYADSRVVLLRDKTNTTILLGRESFESNLGSRYRPSTEDSDAINDGQYGRLRDRLTEYEAEDGRKADHKVSALREALDLLGGSDGTGRTPDPAGDRDANDDSDDGVPFGEIPGIGPETAGKLRVQGFVTATDIWSASDDEILAISGVGPSNLANIRDFLD